jgi:hypothetical protein
MREIGRRLQTGLKWNRCVSTTYDVSPRVRSNRSSIKQIYACTSALWPSNGARCRCQTASEINIFGKYRVQVLLLFEFSRVLSVSRYKGWVNFHGSPGKNDHPDSRRGRAAISESCVSSSLKIDAPASIFNCNQSRSSLGATGLHYRFPIRHIKSFIIYSTAHSCVRPRDASISGRTSASSLFFFTRTRRICSSR